MERVAGNEFPILDGIAPSWAVVQIAINVPGAAPIKAEDIAAINTSMGAVTRGYQLHGGRRRRRTIGSKEDTASLTLYQHGWQLLLAGLLKSPQVYKRGSVYCVSTVVFGISYKYVVPGDPTIFERRIKSATVDGGTLNGAEGDEANRVEVPLSVLEIVDVIDGKEVTTL